MNNVLITNRSATLVRCLFFALIWGTNPYAAESVTEKNVDSGIETLTGVVQVHVQAPPRKLYGAAEQPRLQPGKPQLDTRHISTIANSRHFFLHAKAYSSKAQHISSPDRSRRRPAIHLSARHNSAADTSRHKLAASLPEKHKPDCGCSGAMKLYKLGQLADAAAEFRRVGNNMIKVYGKETSDVAWMRFWEGYCYLLLKQNQQAATALDESSNIYARVSPNNSGVAWIKKMRDYYLK